MLCSPPGGKRKKKKVRNVLTKHEMRNGSAFGFNLWFWPVGVHTRRNCMFVAVVARMAILLHASAIFVSTQHVEGDLLP